jgi:hypothetical protein
MYALVLHYQKHLLTLWTRAHKLLGRSCYPRPPFGLLLMSDCGSVTVSEWRSLGSGLSECSHYSPLENHSPQLISWQTRRGLVYTSSTGTNSAHEVPRPKSQRTCWRGGVGVTPSGTISFRICRSHPRPSQMA